MLCVHNRRPFKCKKETNRTDTHKIPKQNQLQLKDKRTSKYVCDSSAILINLAQLKSNTHLKSNTT